MMDAVLLKIKRLYSKDESVAHLLSELQKANFKNGELLSEIAELKDREKKKGNRVKLSIEDLKEKRFMDLEQRLSEKGKEVSKLKKEIREYKLKEIQGLIKDHL